MLFYLVWLFNQSHIFLNVLVGEIDVSSSFINETDTHKNNPQSVDYWKPALPMKSALSI